MTYKWNVKAVKVHDTHKQSIASFDKLFPTEMAELNPKSYINDTISSGHVPVHLSVQQTPHMR
jgi:hypothetical protein